MEPGFKPGQSGSETLPDLSPLQEGMWTSKEEGAYKQCLNHLRQILPQPAQHQATRTSRKATGKKDDLCWEAKEAPQGHS